MAKKEYFTPDGHKVPTTYVPVLDRKKDTYALRMAKKAQALSDKLLDFKEELLDGADELYLQMLEQAKVQPSSRKGNVTITSFNKDIKIEIHVRDKIDFSDDITIAQEKINEFLELKTKDADTDLSMLVNTAFQTSKGRLDTKRILSLFSIRIKHRLWREAMELIKQSIQRNSTKRYALISKKDKDGEYKVIQLNFASI